MSENDQVVVESWASSVRYFLTQLSNAQQLYGSGAIDAYVRGTFFHSNQTRYYPDWVPFVGMRRSGVLGQLLVLDDGEQRLSHKPAGRFEFRIVRR